MFAEKNPPLKPQPATRFRSIRDNYHAVDDGAGMQVLISYYAALPASPGDIVTERLNDHDLEILDCASQVLRRQPRSWKSGHFKM